MKDNKGHFMRGYCYFIDTNGKKTRLVINDVIGTQDMIMFLEVNPLLLIKLFLLSLVGVSDYKVE